jgi:hypothetical protein
VLPDRETADLVAVAAAAVAALAFLLAVVAHTRLSRLRRSFSLLQGAGAEDDFVTAVNRHITEVAALRQTVARQQQTLDGVRADVTDALRHVAVVRYDAFPDMGGRLSFTVALLDDAGDGLVLTSINGRTETRTYAKGVKGGRSEHSLSPEETQAIDYATRSSRG